MMFNQNQITLLRLVKEHDYLLRMLEHALETLDRSETAIEHEHARDEILQLSNELKDTENSISFLSYGFFN